MRFTPRVAKKASCRSKFEELWVEAQTQLFADSVDVDGYGTWWSYVSHFMGSLGCVMLRLRLPLRALDLPKYELEGEPMVEPYLEVLRAGGSKPPEELARIVGLDLTDPGSEAESTMRRSARHGRRFGLRDRDRPRLTERTRRSSYNRGFVWLLAARSRQRYARA
jgi:hypothetical protein